jgi:hypothetical protein
MSLLEIQRRFAEAMMAPLNAEEGIGERTQGGDSVESIASDIVKPNDRLTAVERIEIYSRSYWFRLISAFNEDFVGLRAVVGDERFDALTQAYLGERPSRSFTLRDLGSQLEAWLDEHPEWTEPHSRLARDIVRLEWAEIEAFDAAEYPALTLNDIAALGEDPALTLQPHVKLLDLRYPVDKLLRSIREAEAEDGQEHDEASNAFSERRKRAHLKVVKRMQEKPVFLIVHRSEFDIWLKRVEPEAFTMLRSLSRGRRLSDAIEAAFAASRRSPQQAEELTAQWFREWAEWGWFARSGSKAPGEN